MKSVVSREGKMYLWRDGRYIEISPIPSSEKDVGEYVDVTGVHWQLILADINPYESIPLVRKLGDDVYTYDGVNSEFQFGMAYDVISIFDCAKYLKRTVQAVHKMVSSDRLKAQRLGNSLYISGRSARALHHKMYGEI